MDDRTRNQIFHWAIEMMQPQLREIVHPAHIKIDRKAAKKHDAHRIGLAQSNSQLSTKAIVIEVPGNRSHGRGIPPTPDELKSIDTLQLTQTLGLETRALG